MACFQIVILVCAVKLWAIGYENDGDQYQWLHIVSHEKECNCELAIDIDDFQQNCPGTQLVMNTANILKKSQHWRWYGKMLKSRANGLVMDLEKFPGRNIILAHATNEATQQFKIYEDDSHIYTFYWKDQIPNVVDMHLKDDTLVGTNLTYFQYNMENYKNQLFDIRHVP